MNKKGKLIAKVKPQKEGVQGGGAGGLGSSSRKSTGWAGRPRATLGLPNAREGAAREKGTACERKSCKGEEGRTKAREGAWGRLVNSIYLFNKSPNCFAIMSNYMVPAFGMFSKPQAQPLGRALKWPH